MPRRRPVRRETIRAQAEGNRYRVTFDAVRTRVILEKSAEPGPRNDVEELLAEMRSILVRSVRRIFTAAEKEKILEVIKVPAS